MTTNICLLSNMFPSRDIEHADKNVHAQLADIMSHKISFKSNLINEKRHARHVETISKCFGTCKSSALTGK